MNELTDIEERLPGQLKRLSEPIGLGGLSRSGIERRVAERARQRRRRARLSCGAFAMVLVAAVGAVALPRSDDGRRVVTGGRTIGPAAEGIPAVDSTRPEATVASAVEPTTTVASVTPPAPSTTQTVAPAGTTPVSTRLPVTTATPPLPPKPTSHVQFTMPSGNIGCFMSSPNGVVRCDIRQRDWAPPAKPADCMLDFGQGLVLGGGGTAFFVCAGDTVRGVGPVLPYGSTIRHGPFECRSDESGVECTNLDTGHGFLLSAAEYRLF
jgi:hypothetical protein